MAQKIGLNVGSGQRPFVTTPEVAWVNVDSQAKWYPDLLCSGDNLPYPDGSIDYFVLHHVLEHFGCGEGAGVIKEAYRVLRKGGIIAVCVPDMAALARGWFEGKIDAQIYMTNVYGAYMGSEDDRHKWGYDLESLERFLYHSAPWRLSTAKIRDIPGADIARDWWILEMECVK